MTHKEFREGFWHAIWKCLPLRN